MPQDAISKALLGRISMSVLSEFGREDLHVAEAPPGLVLGAAHLELLRKLEEDRLDDAGSLARLVELSRIVDTIQPGTGRMVSPGEGRGFVSDVFTRIAANARFDAVPLDAAARKAYASALERLYEPPSEDKISKSAGYGDFCQMRADVEKKEPVLLEFRRQLGATVQPEVRDALSVEIELLESLIREQRQALDALDRAGGFSEAERVVEASERRVDDFPRAIRRALDLLELLLIADPVSGTQHVGCSFFPAALSEDNWIQVKLTRAEIEAMGAQAQEPAGPEEIDLSGIDAVELEVQTLTVDRPWFWPALFENANWTWQSPSRPVSSGAPGADEEALLPAYVHALVFARNLSVRQRPGTGKPPRWVSSPVTRPAGFLNRVLVAQVAGAAPQAVSGMVFRPATLPAAQLMTRPLEAGSARAAARAGRARARASGPDPRQVVLAAGIARRDVVPVVRARPARSAAVHGSQVLSASGAAAIRVGQLAPAAQLPGPARRWPGLVPVLSGMRFTGAGVVQDESGRPVTGARIRLAGGGSRFTSSGADGAFSFAGLPAGRHAVAVTRPGYRDARGVLAIPQKGPVRIRLAGFGDGRVTVELVARRSDGGTEPFLGRARVAVETRDGPRIEAMTGRSTAAFHLPAGGITLGVTAPEAHSAEPARVSFDLEPGASRTVRFEMTIAATLQNPGTQLLAFVCRRVPASPRGA